MTCLVAAVAAELGGLDGVAVGIGPVRSALGAADLLARRLPTAVILIGTAGAYPGGPEVGTVIAARRVGLSRGIAALGLGYVPAEPEALTTSAALRARLALPEADVLTVEAITTDPAHTARLGASWQVEHMEAWSVGAAARAAGVPFVAVLGIANRVGPDAHAEWLAHRAAAEGAARAAVQVLLTAGASP
ncbi:MAG: phosphorylase [Alphaproteobacteria bacterium]|nr:phosphorylase [Alphaproteobacteria bacterium]